ncbi:MAG: FG-GAP-like repeat-containing protein [Candidatus Nanoarchaeia archaeon]|jgi:PGF-pre-PGF domain-containing protein
MWKRGILAIAIIAIVCIIAYFVIAATQTYLAESSQWEQNLTAVQWSSATFGDINKDNLTDLILAGCKSVSQTTCNGYITKVYINNGTSLIDNTIWDSNLTGVNRASLALKDINNDGNLDLILVGCSSGGGNGDCSSRKAFVYINNGTTFNDNINWSTNITGIYYGSLALGDINNDGWSDLVITGSGISGNLVKVYLNNGTTFTSSYIWGQELTGMYMSSTTLGDINNDGNLDLILSGNAGSETTKVYLNNETSFAESTQWQQNLPSLDDTSFTLGDYDNDGYLDLTFIGHYTGDIHRIYENNGSSFILHAYEAWDGGTLTGIYDGSITYGDYNNDGKLDIAVTGHEGYTRIYDNNNSNFSRVETGISDLSYAGSIVWNDIDNDGDLDLLLTGWSSSSGEKALIYINNISLTQNNSIPYSPSTFDNHSLANGNIFLGWNNGSDNETISIGLYYNLRVGTTSKGNDIVSGIFGGSSNPVAGYFGNMMQRRNISLSGSRFTVGQTYYWSVQTIDTGLAKSAWSTEQTFNLSSDFTPPTITLNTPSSGLVTNQTTDILFNATVVDDYSVSNVSLYGNWSGSWHNNQTNESHTNSVNYFFKANLTEGEWLWGVRSCDNMSNCRGSNSTFRIDITYPIVNLMNPMNSGSQTSSNSITFTYNVSDVAINNCTLYLNGIENETDISVTVNTSQTFAENVPNGNYNWTIRCADAANNINTTANFSLTVSYTPDTTPPSTSSGGGGGGGGAISVMPKVSRIIASVAAGNNLIEFAESEKASVGIEEIMLNSATAASNVKLTIEKLTAMPEGIAASPSGDIYSYLQFNKTVLKDEDVKNAKITFTVSKDWIAKNNLDYNTIVLQRYTTKWNVLSTTYLKQNASNYYYESTTPGFSVFAITAEKKEIPAAGQESKLNKSEQEKEEVPMSPALEMPNQEQEKRSIWLWIIAPAALIATFAAIALSVMLKRKKK